MALTDGKGFSYIDSIGTLLPAVVVACRSRAALIFALLHAKITITVNKATMLTAENIARELIDAI